jgi:CubicO group peptidase (beta-lactamase class C family)
MAGYAQALLQGGVGEGGRILRSDTLQQIWSTHYRPDPRIPGMGLGFFLDRLGKHRVVGHDGNLPGFAAGLLLAPEEGLGVVALTNTATPFGMHLLTSSVLGKLLGCPTRRRSCPSERSSSGRSSTSSSPASTPPIPGC